MSIVLQEVSKHFGGHAAVDRVSCEIRAGELFVLLGGSGSGKSTILRLIAGLLVPDHGRILLGDRDVTQVPPQARGTGFVFQNYSIFRHMTVAQNIEFGLKIRKVPATERARRRDELLDAIGLAGLGERHADALSGGQQQRVALARALAYQPGVLLLDEPFGALDSKIRQRLRRLLKHIQRDLKLTTILVTHDQEEAFELADRIGVVESGRIVEMDAGEKLYRSPRTLKLATFLGAGNVLIGRVEQGQARLGPVGMPIAPRDALGEGAPVQVLIRPESIRLQSEVPRPGAVSLGRGPIIEHDFTGPLRRLRLRLPSLAGTRQVAPAPAFGEEGLLIDAVVPATHALPRDEQYVVVDAWHVLEPAPARILVCDRADGPPHVLRAARRLAERMQAAVTVLAVSRDRAADDTWRESITQRVREAGLRDAEINLVRGPLESAFATEQSTTTYELVIAGVGDAARQSVRLGASLGAILKNTVLPVLLIRDELNELRRILICTAAGEPGQNDVRIGGRLAQQTGAEVTLLHVARPGGEAGVRKHFADAMRLLKHMDVAARSEITASSQPAERILAAIGTADHDLVVIGAHRDPSRAVRDRENVMLEIIARSPRPVMVVPARE